MSAPDHWLISTQPATTFVRFWALNSSILRTHMSPSKSKKRSSGSCSRAKAYMAFESSYIYNQHDHGKRTYLGLELVGPRLDFPRERRQVLGRSHTERREGPARVRQSLTRKC